MPACIGSKWSDALPLLYERIVDSSPDFSSASNGLAEAPVSRRWRLLPAQGELSTPDFDPSRFYSLSLRFVFGALLQLQTQRFADLIRYSPYDIIITREFIKVSVGQYEYIRESSWIA